MRIKGFEYDTKFLDHAQLPATAKVVRRADIAPVSGSGLIHFLFIISEADTYGLYHFGATSPTNFWIEDKTIFNNEKTPTRYFDQWQHQLISNKKHGQATHELVNEEYLKQRPALTFKNTNSADNTVNNSTSSTAVKVLEYDFNFYDIELIDVEDFKKYESDDEYVFEVKDSSKVFNDIIMLTDGGAFEIYDPKTKDLVNTVYTLVDDRGVREYTNTLFIGYRDRNGHLCMTDLARYSETSNVRAKAWKVRRGMLSLILRDLFPNNADIYDSKAPVYLSEVVQDEDKAKCLRKKKKSHIVAQNINHTFGMIKPFTLP